MGCVTYEQEGYVGKITLNRPKVLNALNRKLLLELKTVLREVDLNQTRCLILTGAGERAFAAGADIGEMSSFSKEEGRTFSACGNDIFLELENFPIPIIAAINGLALGGGCELAISCDIRICTEETKFGQPEVCFGITPGFGGTQRLARIVGSGKAKELIYTGSTIDGKEAYRIGLVNGLYGKEELMEAASRLAKTIGDNPPVAVQNSKYAINKGCHMEMKEAIKIEEKVFGNCFETKDQQEAMAAFLKK
ncbi:enoyl-CoA hydratase [Aequitasia blattaphilus]|uniref:Enoyl-CoA hydratase-related protein n=1 Tax=Aequitasia blattaphilus TaxID=2949332 RepID=A0ABT1EER0_9FIRM|nr:enoyl-CoA hydratase-related protein [Aequitasia blattaphilus]MCP1102952.1 enoyl-CoA hydratase-related protein [Aequitasia blattaphilus]MCR8615592.1 enoyl-CoA hydratase-related protein [Aequitasia blattaphilus]